MNSSTLGRVANIKMGQSPPGHTYNEDGNGLPFFQGVRDFNYRFPTSRVYCTAPARISEPGDILLSIRAPIGRVNVASERCATGRGIAIIRPRDTADARYIEFALRHMESYWYVLEGGGAVFGNAKRSDLESFQLPWPEKPHRKKIAAILSAYDDLIENNTRRIRILEEMAQAIYREWFVHFRFPGYQHARFTDSPFGLIPEGWEVLPLGEFVETFRGRSYRSVDLADEGGLPFLNLKCIDRDGGFRRSGLKRYTGEYKVSHVSKKGDIVVAVTDMTQERRIVARAALVPTLDKGFGVCSMDLVRIESKPQMPKLFLYGLLRYSSFADEVKQHANGVNVLHLTPERITDFQFAVPPANLMCGFANFVIPSFEQIDTLENMIETLRHTRDLLLPKLISGELDVSELEIITGEPNG